MLGKREEKIVLRYRKVLKNLKKKLRNKKGSIVKVSKNLKGIFLGLGSPMKKERI